MKGLRYLHLQEEEVTPRKVGWWWLRSDFVALKHVESKIRLRYRSRHPKR